MIADAAKRTDAETVIEPNVASALRRARGLVREGEVVVATGSLYIVGEAREALGLATASDEPAFDPWARPSPQPSPTGSGG